MNSVDHREYRWTMRYLVIANNSGGLFRFRKELMKRFIDDGHEVYAVTPFDEFVDELRALGLHLIEQKMNRRGKNPFQELRLLKDYRSVIKRVAPDMIMTYTIKPGIYGGLLARWLKLPYAVNITGLGTAFENEGLLRTLIVRLWKMALRSAGCVFFENEENASVFLNFGIVSKDKIHVLHGAGVNLQDFSFESYPEDSDPLRFLFIGRVMREKGIDELLTAMKDLHRKYPNILLDVVGWCEEDYEARLEVLQRQGIVHFHGFQCDVKPYIRQAHAFVLPSYHEGMANTLLESAAMGRPLITSNIHGCKEAVQDGKTGFLCEARNAQSLMQQMERFINLPYDQKRKMGQASHDFVAERFDKKKVVEETVGVLYEVTAHHV